ncbi:hypothetical protein CTAM01_03422 [Colletotrichum tamarilloi]|uniref:Uncharacterized protein n=1 Tax=Colletotrichum tamarilloi TaxID=1209934 RepID=A0ABQ9RJN4_9PEZI|nr:uncharacterized protein CTAM01_03422 [Colletotrichum tamarilloi]KAK1506087.1 hypothetical protein CTAM01_03422 [Colletotrichum tamarilloi]
MARVPLKGLKVLGNPRWMLSMMHALKRWSGRRTAVLLRAEVIGHPYPKGPNKSGSHLPPYKKSARLEPQCRTSDRWKPQEQVPKFCQLSLQPQVPPVPVGRMAKGEF